MHAHRTERTPLPVATAIWHCDTNYIVCHDDHLLAFHRAGYRADLRRLSGHTFFECRECSPPSYFFALFAREPTPMVTCYLLHRDSYEEWSRASDIRGTPPTPELLYRLRDPEGRSYNPYFRPPR